MRRHFTRYYQLRTLCKQLADLVDIVEAEEGEELVEDIAHAAINAVSEQRNDYLEFVHQPKIWKQFDKWMEKETGYPKHENR